MTNYKFKKYYCCEKGKEPRMMEYPSSSLYIVVNRKCNAICPFCTFRGSVERVQIDKLYAALKEITSICNIGTVHLTGGEPSLYVDDVKAICDCIKYHNFLITTSVNTNGYALSDLLQINSLDNIALSRHSISDAENQKIFHTNTVPTIELLKSVPHKEKLHLSCNLIKGYVDSYEKIIEYLNFAGDTVLCNDVGFVGLMPVNDYCKEKYVEMPELCGLCKSREFEDKEKDKIYCKCTNYLHITPQCHMVSAYHRQVVGKRPFSDTFIFENNTLRQGW